MGRSFKVRDLGRYSLGYGGGQSKGTQVLTFQVTCCWATPGQAPAVPSQGVEESGGEEALMTLRPTCLLPRPWWCGGGALVSAMGPLIAFPTQDSYPGPREDGTVGAGCHPLVLYSLIVEAHFLPSEPTAPAPQGVSILLTACPGCHGSPEPAWRAL